MHASKTPNRAVNASWRRCMGPGRLVMGLITGAPADQSSQACMCPAWHMKVGVSTPQISRSPCSICTSP